MSVKDNHYVPRFYLRNFTHNPATENGRFDFLNLKSKEHIGIIPHGSQMKEKYFYKKGSDIDERLDREFERKHATLAKEIMAGKISIENKLLLEIVLLMHFRTRIRRDQDISLRRLMIDQNLDGLITSFKTHLKEKFPSILGEMSDENLKKIVKDGAYSEYLKKTDIAEKQITNFKFHRKQIRDLTAVILENPNEDNLISSDHPVIHINPFLIKHKSKFGREGLAQMGVVLLLPINPKKIIVCYDAGVYQNPLDIHQGQLSKTDIEKLNKLQILCGAEGIYSTQLRSNIATLTNDILRAKQEPVFVTIDFPNNYQMTYTDSKLPNFIFTFIKEKEGFDEKTFVPPYPRPAQIGIGVLLRKRVKRFSKGFKKVLQRIFRLK